MAATLHGSTIQRLFASGLALRGVAASGDLGDGLADSMLEIVNELDHAVIEIQEAIDVLLTST